MTERPEALTQASAPSYSHEGSYVDWSSILAGAVVATSIAFIFSTFGAALGLTMVSPYEGEGSATFAAIAVGSWMLWTTVSSFMVGGYITGRMRRRVDGASADEVAIRDGIHGLTVWAVAILFGALVLTSAADSALQATTEVSSAAVEAVGDAVAGTEASSTEANTTLAAPSEAEIKAVAETARKTAIIAAFALAASLMIAGAGAYWAAGVGGQHRDEGRVFERFGRWT